MELQHCLRLQLLAPPLEEKCLRSFPSVFGVIPQRRNKRRSSIVSSLNLNNFGPSAPKFWRSQLQIPAYDSDLSKQVRGLRQKGLKASKLEELLKFGNGEDDPDESESESESESDSDGGHKRDDYFHMDEDERREWRRKIRDVIKNSPDVEEEVDLVERRKKMQKLLADYPLVVDEDDPDWPEDADGRGFNLDQFFNKITIKNVKKDDDDDNENDDSDNELVWQDDDYIRPVKDLTTAKWEETVFKDISPLIVLVHNRYKRPKENEMVRDELEKAIHIIWNCRLPSPRCVAIDAVVDVDLVSALEVSVFPELIFTKAGKILYREKVSRTADELSKMMAFFYYGAAKPPCLNGIENSQELIPTV
ncbi:hypothetical protein RND71_039375 [Anisodus tanguticus]|uniref:Thioredoxin-like fold domain-containing protein MRL7L, chloroplastic n=1 Tax=Anisodus tanguticus TaxID=243964 RepID=A0AAE1QVS3_9SOLA|nr:hypothetical protein RND71_039375 [Anisodus tanguticus]